MNKAPDIIVLDTSKIVNDFIIKTKKIITKEDVIEIITQILDVLIDNRVNKHNLPNNIIDNKRLIGASLITNNDINSVLNEAALELFKAIVVILENNGICENNSINYYFDKLIGKDIVLKRFDF